MLKKLRSAGNGLFVWKIFIRVDGKGVHRHITATSEGAHQLYAEMANAKARASFGLPYKLSATDKTLEAAAVEYEKHLYTEQRNDEHVGDVIRELSILRKQLGDEHPVNRITRAHLIEFQRKRSLCEYHKRTIKPRTVNKALAILSGFFSWCVPHYIDSNPAVKLKIKEIAPPLKILFWSDFCLLADAADERPCLRLLIEVLGETGARIDEIFTAKVSDVDLTSKTWHKVIKPGRRVSMEAGPWVVMVAYHSQKDAPLCPREDGKPWTYSMVRKAFKRLTTALGMAYFSPHHIRHGRACWDLVEGKGIYAVKEKLGHTTVTTTERYLRSLDMVRRSETPGVVHSRPVLQLCSTQPKTTSIAPSYATVAQLDNKDITVLEPCS